MHADKLVDRLVSDLTPVSRPRMWRDIGLLILLVAIELGLYVGFGRVRADLELAMAQPVWWWKIGSTSALAMLATIIAVRSFVPAQDAPLARKSLAPLIILVIIAGWGINALTVTTVPMLDRLHWQTGLQCIVGVLGRSIVPMLAIGVMMRRGASTNPALSANAAGLAAAGWGSAIFAFHCPHDDVLYVSVWYATAMLLLVGTARLVLPRLTRW